MTLLITQMKNQDPLNPLDNAQVTSQLAQLSTVTGIDKLNATMGTLKGSYQSSQALQATSLIGHGVLVPGNSTNLADGKAVLGMDLPRRGRRRSRSRSRDSAGNAVRKIDLGAQAAGTVPLAGTARPTSGAAALPMANTASRSAPRSGGSKAERATALVVRPGRQRVDRRAGVKLNLRAAARSQLADVRQII